MKTKNILVILFTLLLFGLFAADTDSNQRQARLLMSQAAADYQKKHFNSALAKYTEIKKKYIALLTPLEQAKVYIGIGDAYYEIKQYNKGIEDYAKAADILETNKLLLKIQAPTQLYNRWGEGYEFDRKSAQAESVYLRGIKHICNLFGNKYSGLILLHARLGDLYLQQKKYMESYRHIAPVISCNKYLEEQSDWGKMKLYQIMTTACTHTNKLDEAINMWNKEAEFTLKLYGSDSPQMAIAYTGLALIYHQQKKSPNAIKELNHAYSILKRKLGINHKATKCISDLLQEWIAELNKGQ